MQNLLRNLAASATALLGAAALLLPLSAIASACDATSESRSVSIHCGSAPSATFDDNGRLWVTYVQNQHVYVSYSDDLGASYATAVAVNPVKEDAEHNGENRPKIILDEDSNIFVSWTRKTSPRFTGEIRFSRSIDGGSTFDEPRTINDDKLFTGHRFESLYLTESGHLYITWIDKRDLEASIEIGEDYAGAAIYYAVSTDQGASFSTNYRVANNSCECCRIAIAPHGPANIAILWRQIFGETTRDHAIAVLTPNGETQQLERASYDEWQIDACPHHGPTMVKSSKSDDYHISWFTNGALHQGIYYARYSFAKSQPEHIFRVDGRAGAGHPFLAEYAGTLNLVWKAFDGQNTNLSLIQSTDDGVTWSAPQLIHVTSQGSDYPLLVTGEEGLYLSWHTQETGYVFEKLTADGETYSDD
ncbi:MAG: sialidase family protein [Pseudohongiellaceae bacterium]